MCDVLFYSVICSRAVSVALTGRSFGHYQNEDMNGFIAICDSDEGRLDECQTDIEYCDSEESAGVICEGMHTIFKQCWGSSSLVETMYIYKIIIKTK